MPYPSKTDRKTILAAATEQAATEGLENLSLRSLAASLGLAPNALYRYFTDKAHLEAAISAHVAIQLHLELVAACGRRKPEQALLHMARAYMRFAQTHPSLYQIFMACRAMTPEDQAAHEELWLFVVAQVAQICDAKKAPEAAVALWALLHGFAALQSAGAISEVKPASGLEFGLHAWMTAVRTTSSRN